MNLIAANENLIVREKIESGERTTESGIVLSGKPEERDFRIGTIVAVPEEEGKYAEYLGMDIIFNKYCGVKLAGDEVVIKCADVLAIIEDNNE